MKVLRILGFGVVMLLTGCQGKVVAAEPALLLESGPEIQQQLQRFIVSVVGGTEVTLADDVLQQSPELFIEQRMPVDGRGLPLDGRHSLPAYRFVLVKSGEQCIVQHPGSGKSVSLQGARCKLAP